MSDDFKSRRPYLALMGVSLYCTLIGCGGGGSQALSGSVSFRSEPIQEGVIQFYTPDGQPSPVAGAAIKNGRYEIPDVSGVLAGKYIVRISARQWVKEGEESQKNPFLSKELIPEKYNARSELQVDVSPRGTRTFDFQLD